MSKPDLEILEAASTGMYFTGIVYPNHPLRSFARRRALCQQDENERVAQGLEPGHSTPSCKSIIVTLANRRAS